MKRFSRNYPIKQELAVLLASGEPQLHKALLAAITHVLENDHTLKFTGQGHIALRLRKTS